MKRCAAAIVIILAAWFGYAQDPATPVIVQIDLADIVHPVSAEYVAAGIQHAKDIGAQAVILRLDTPGGLADSMRAIVESILTSPVPVITWVGPNGSRSASAGFFILESGDVAVMAPGSNTGAVVGAFLVVFFLESTRFVTATLPGLKPVQVAAVREFLIGASLIVVLRVRPSGLIPERLPRHAPPAPAGVTR